MKLWDYLLENNEKSSAKRYLRDIHIYIDAVGEEEAYSATYQDVMNYIAELRKIHKNPQYIKCMVAGIKKYYTYLVHVGIREDNPAKNINLKDKRKDIQLQDLFSTEELEQLMQRKERYGELELKNRVIISLLIYQALPTGSIVHLKTKDVDLEAGEIYVKSTNMTNSRTLSLKPNQILLFHKYLTEARPQMIKRKTDALVITKLGTAENGEGIHYLVSTFQKLFPERKLNPKTIRQSVITNLLKQGHNLRIVQVFAGHKYPGATEKYKQTQVDALQDGVNKYHPLG